MIFNSYTFMSLDLLIMYTRSDQFITVTSHNDIITTCVSMAFSNITGFQHSQLTFCIAYPLKTKSQHIVNKLDTSIVFPLFSATMYFGGLKSLWSSFKLDKWLLGTTHWRWEMHCFCLKDAQVQIFRWQEDTWPRTLQSPNEETRNDLCRLLQETEIKW